MNIAIKELAKSLARLFQFVIWYIIAVAAVFYLLPIVGLFLGGRYDAMSSSIKFFSIIGFFIVVAVWQVSSHQKRIKSSMQQRHHGRMSSV